MKYPATDKYNETGFPPPLDPGEYTLTLTAVSDCDQDGNPYKTKDGAQLNVFWFDVVEFPEHRIREQFVFDEDYKHASVNLGRFKAMLIAMGVPTDKPGDVADLIGRQCGAFINQRHHEGKIYNNILRFIPTEGVAESNDDDDKLPF